jgi:hypothetical protein
MAELWDNPNQQVVRADSSGPGDEGTGGQSGEQAAEEAEGLEGMTKDELLAYAQEHGVSPANASMNKADIIASIRAAEKQEEGD